MDIWSNRQVVVEFHAEDICNRYRHVSRILQRCFKQEDLEELDKFVEECCKICRDTFQSNLMQVGSGTDLLVIRPIERATRDMISADIVIKVLCAQSPPYKYRIKDDKNQYVCTHDMNKILPIICEELKRASI